VLEIGQVAGDSGLRSPENPLNIADAKLPGEKQVDNAQASLIGQTPEVRFQVGHTTSDTLCVYTHMHFYESFVKRSMLGEGCSPKVPARKTFCGI
jgi:hypothetical protein